MTSNCYIIDTSSLVKLNRENPLDVYPSVWKKLEGLITAGRLIAPKEVLNEISQNDDQLTKWVKKHRKMFKEPTQKQIEIVQQILKDHPSLIDVDRKFDADPWVIALAIEMATSTQKTLFKIKRIVVTEEKLRGNRENMPFISAKLSIEAIDLITMFRTEGWKF
jgi:rRNA maturation endonuclease Nob1